MELGQTGCSPLLLLTLHDPGDFLVLRLRRLVYVDALVIGVTLGLLDAGLGKVLVEI